MKQDLTWVQVTSKVYQKIHLYSYFYQWKRRTPLYLLRLSSNALIKGLRRKYVRKLVIFSNVSNKKYCRTAAVAYYQWKYLTFKHYRNKILMRKTLKYMSWTLNLMLLQDRQYRLTAAFKKYRIQLGVKLVNKKTLFHQFQQFYVAVFNRKVFTVQQTLKFKYIMMQMKLYSNIRQAEQRIHIMPKFDIITVINKKYTLNNLCVKQILTRHCASMNYLAFETIYLGEKSKKYIKRWYIKHINGKDLIQLDHNVKKFNCLLFYKVTKLIHYMIYLYHKADQLRYNKLKWSLVSPVLMNRLQSSQIIRDWNKIDI